MGIQGLMSFILQRSYMFLEEVKLHDTYLVIDGVCISLQIYHLNECHSCFGGDYEKYTFYVNQFFDELQKCNIIPIVFSDWGCSEKKFSTIHKHRQESVNKILNSNPRNKQKTIPLLQSIVFKNILRKRKIICIQSVFEAVNDITLTAKILNSPVLSFDSDFFLFDVLYIPYNTFKEGICRNVTGTGYFKLCQVFKYDYLVKSYPGLNKNVLLLSAALLGNDFVNPIIFRKFFSTLKVPKTLKESVTYVPHLKVEAVFRWLQNHSSLDSAITAILYKIDTDKQQKVIETVETIINEYLQFNVSSVMLEPLGFSQEEIDTFVNKFHYKKYKFEKLDNWKIEENLTHDECYLTCDENDLMNSLSLEDEEELFFCPSKSRNVIDIIPPWFLKKYHAGAFPSYFINILDGQCIFVFEEEENISSFPTSFNISLKIMSVIFRLLTAGMNLNSNTLKYITRGNRIYLETCELDCNKYKFNFSIPSLEELEDYPADKKKHIFLETMGVSEKLLVKFPPRWRQFIASIKFWLNEAEELFRTKYHLYAVIFNIIWHVIKEMKNSNFVNMNESSEKQKNDCSILVEDMPIKDALENVNIHDCIRSERFFESQMYVNKREFDITIVHAFSLLQNCIKSCIHLSELLGDPYPRLDVAEFFNGILVYNIFNEIKLDKRLNHRVCTIFENSPSILQLFVSISKQILLNI